LKYRAFKCWLRFIIYSNHQSYLKHYLQDLLGLGVNEAAPVVILNVGAFALNPVANGGAELCGGFHGAEF